MSEIPFGRLWKLRLVRDLVDPGGFPLLLRDPPLLGLASSIKEGLELYALECGTLDV